MEFLAAICQRPPALLDKGASMAAALAAVAEAAERGARLITFSEAFLPGYPTWVWRLRPGADMALGNEIHRQLQRNAIDVDTGDLDPLRDAAAKHGMVIVMGMHELDSAFAPSSPLTTTVLNSVEPLYALSSSCIPMTITMPCFAAASRSGSRSPESTSIALSCNWR